MILEMLATFLGRKISDYHIHCLVTHIIYAPLKSLAQSKRAGSGLSSQLLFFIL